MIKQPAVSTITGNRPTHGSGSATTRLGSSMGVDRRRPAGTYVLPLAEAENVSRCGGKAASLAKMMRAGAPVPDGIVVTGDAFVAFVRTNGLEDEMAQLTSLDPRDRNAIAQAARSLQTKILGGSLSKEIRDEIREAVEPFADCKLAVRSSAVGEDSDEASFAGQLDSYLDVSASNVEAKVIHCWASCFNERAIFYQLVRKVPLRTMGVVVQELVDARFAGVLFTVAPSPFSDRSMLGEYCYGLGEALVSGAINPGRFTVDRETRAIAMLAKPEQDDNKGEETLPRHELGERAVIDLAKLARALEDAFGGPQDIEWAIGNDETIYLLQSRPITAGIANGKTSAGGRRVVWSNANVNENFPDPISPLLYSIARTGYYYYFRNIGSALGISESRLQKMEHPLRHIIGVHGARMYYNLTNIYDVLSAAPYGDLLGSYFDQFVGVTDGGGESATRDFGQTRAGEKFELAQIAMRTARTYSALEARIRGFEATVDDFAARMHPDSLAKKSRAELHDGFRAFIDIRCKRWLNASLADTAAMVTYGLLKELLRRAFPGEDQAALHNTLLKGLSDVISTKPVEALWDLSRIARRDPTLAALFKESSGLAIWERISQDAEFKEFHIATLRYLEDWGYRGSRELMLTVPSFQENPAALMDVVRTYVLLEGPSPLEVIGEQSRQRDEETKRVLDLLKTRPVSRFTAFVPFANQAVIGQMLVSATRKSIACRERARLKQALLYSRLRRLVLAIGQDLTRSDVLEEANDIFFLTHEEIDALLASGAMFPRATKELIRTRKAEHAALSQMSPPDTLILAEGDSYEDAASAEPSPDSSMIDHADGFSGTATCGGRVQAPATVMLDMSEAHRLAAGDILITKQTDPGWAPVFFLIKGLVMERGGMLSHGAIIAREFGIPAVVGIQGATTRIRQGQIIIVDGDKGHVRFVDN